MDAYDSASQLLEEGDRLVAEIHALEGQGPRLLCLYLRLEDVTARATAALGEVPS